MTFVIQIAFPHPGVYVISARVAFFARELEAAGETTLLPFPFTHNLRDEIIIVRDEYSDADAAAVGDKARSCENSPPIGTMQLTLPLEITAHECNAAIGRGLNERGVALAGATVSQSDAEQAEVCVHLLTLQRRLIGLPQAFFIRAATHASADAMLNLAVLYGRLSLKSNALICSGVLLARAAELGHPLSKILHGRQNSTCAAARCFDHASSTAAASSSLNIRNESSSDLASMYAVTAAISSVIHATSSVLGFNDMDPSSEAQRALARACSHDAIIVRLLLNPQVALPLSAISASR